MMGVDEKRCRILGASVSDRNGLSDERLTGSGLSEVASKNMFEQV